MPPPPFSACRFAAHWVADALAGDEALDFSFVKALVGVLPESLAGAPKETRERVALRCLQEVVSLAAPGEGEVAAVAGGGTLRVDATRSCEELLIELLGQVGSSGSLEKDMLPPFSKDIQKFICIKTPALPETSFELLREVNTGIACMVPPPPVEKGGKNNGIDQSLCSINPDHHVNAERHGCPTDSSDLQRESVTDLVNETFTRNVQKDPMVPTPDFHEPSMLRPQEDTIGVGVSVRSAQTSPSSDNERNLQTAGVVPSVSCNGAVQGDKSETNLLQENATGPSKLFKEKNDKVLLEVSCADKANPALHDDGNILENNTSDGRKTTLDSPCCNAMETSNVHRSNDSPSGFAAACLLSLMGNMPSCSQDKDANGSTQGFTEQDLCIKCGKDGQLLKCTSCSLVSHESCFGSSVTFDVSGQFHCPVCFYTKASEAYQKAKKTYLEARKSLSAFLGTKQFPKEHHEQSTGKQQTATISKDHLNEHNTSKRQGRSEADDLSHKGEEPGEQRKKQRTNDTSDVHPEEGQLNGCDTSKRQGNHQSVTSSNNSGKLSSPPWRNMRHHKARFQEKETVVSYNSKKALRCQDQQMPSPSSKRYQSKRCCNSLAPPGRRPKLCWTEEEEQALRDAMLKFTPEDDAPIPWTQILEYGRDTFHRSRLASDLRVKWRNMKKKSGS